MAEIPLPPIQLDRVANVEAKRLEALEELSPYYTEAALHQDWVEQIRAVANSISTDKQRSQSAGRFPNFSPELVGLLAGPVAQPDSRRLFAQVLDEQAQVRSRRLREIWRETYGNDPIPCDFLIVGTGPYGTLAASALQFAVPGATVFSIDERNYLGGQFRNPGAIGPYGGFADIYEGNSRNGPVNFNSPNLPGKEGSLNLLGRFVTAQTSNVAKGAYFTNGEIGVLTAGNSLVAVPTALSLDAIEIADNRGRYAFANIIVTRDCQNGDEYLFNPKATIFASGLGEKNYGIDTTDPSNRRTLELSKNRFDALLSALESGSDETVELFLNNFPPALHVEDFFQLIGNKRLTENARLNLYRRFSGKNILVVGGADYALLAGGWFARLLPRAAYGTATLAVPFPNYVELCNCLFQENTENDLRNRYAPLKDFFIPSKDTPTSRAGFIYPSRNGKLTDIDFFGGDKILASFEDGDFGIFNFILFATGYKQTSLIDNSKLRTVKSERNSKLEVIGRRVFGTEVYFNTLSSVVAASKSELRKVPAIQQFRGEESKNIVSLWRNTPKADALTIKQPTT